ncbi:hypothetical protein VSR34_27665 [Paraburkholderia sp. JHI2823]
MNELILPGNGLSMSSREIADLVCSRHNDVVATVEPFSAKGVFTRKS